MRVFFKTVAEVDAFLECLASVSCPRCGARGAMIRHGCIHWFRTPEEHGIRAWRVHCQKRRGCGGCGHAPSIRLGGYLPGHCCDAGQLWAFMQALIHARSIKAAWEQAGIPLSLDTGYRLHRRMLRCLSVLRTRLCARAPPPEGEKAGTPLHETLAHLTAAFATRNPIADYQVHFQQGFLALA